MNPAIKRLILVVFLGLELALVLVATTDRFSSVSVSDVQLYISMGALAVAYVGYLKLMASAAQRNQVREKERTGRLLETVPLPALLLGADGRINFINQRAQRVLGLGLEHVDVEAASLFEAAAPHPLKGGFSGSAKARCLPSSKDVELTVEFRGDSSGSDSIVLVRPIEVKVEQSPTANAAGSCNPKEVIEAAVADFKPWLDFRKVTLELDIKDGLSVPMSQGALRDAMCRLLLRSLASSPDGGALHVTLSGGEGVEISVTDRGAGINPASAEQGPGGPSLTFVRSAAEAAGGTLTIEGAPGKGCRITARF